MITTVLFGAAMLFIGALLASYSRPFAAPARCPSCHVRFLTLPQPADATRPYEVHICPHCANTCTEVHGAPSRFARCPRCYRRTLEIPARRLPPTPEAPIAVAIEEHCHVCGYREDVVLPPPQLPVLPDNVIPFVRR